MTTDGEAGHGPRLGVDADLTIRCGRHTHPWRPDRGRWIEEPTADFACLRCGYTATASGAAAVARFAATIRTRHLPDCPTPRKD